MVLLASRAHFSRTADVPVTDACHLYCLCWCDVTVSGSIISTGNRIKMSLHALGPNIPLSFYSCNCKVTSSIMWDYTEDLQRCWHVCFMSVVVGAHQRSRRHSVWQGLLDRKVNCLHLVQPVAEHSVMVDCVTNATHLPHHCHICTWMAHEYCVLCTWMCYIVVLYLILLGSHATLVHQFCYRAENKITFCAARFLLLTNLFHLHMISCECWTMFS
jgi:hypothetical protein